MEPNTKYFWIAAYFVQTNSNPDESMTYITSVRFDTDENGVISLKSGDSHQVNGILDDAAVAKWAEDNAGEGITVYTGQE